MGYCYDQNHRLCCDICGNAGGVRKIPCPVGWCQSVAACPECRTAKKHIPEDKHAHCRENMREKADNISAMKAGKLAITVKEIPDRPGWLRPEEWDHYSTACDIFNKTWLEPPDVELLRSWGNTVTQVSA